MNFRGDLFSWGKLHGDLFALENLRAGPEKFPCWLIPVRELTFLPVPEQNILLISVMVMKMHRAGRFPSK